MQTRIAAYRFSLRQHWLIRGAAALLAIAAITALPGRAQAGVYVSVNIAPPPLPVYVQPAVPGPGYMWTPGYWAWDGYAYYWVPGTWVLAPYTGALWTPGYWGWSGGAYVFHGGYWGLHVGFYGGIAYGFGYTGYGYAGGYWGGNNFYYNRTVNHVTNNITNVYNKTVVNNTTIINHTSYNGGAGGVVAHATPQQQAWAREPRTAPVAAQVQQREMASRMPALRASANHGAPAIAATPRAGTFAGHGVVAAHGVPTAMAAHVASYAPHSVNAVPRPDALRSASFAPHAGMAMSPDHASRYAQPNAYATPRSRVPERYTPENHAYRNTPYQPQAYHPAPRGPQPMYRPANPRPAQYAHVAPPRAHAAPPPHAERRDERHH